MWEADPVPGAAGAGAGIRWNLWDAVAAWVVGILCSLFAAAPFLPADGAPAREEIPALVAALFAQALGIVGYLALVSARNRGLGSLALDFGLRFEARAAEGVAVPSGLLVAGLANLLLLPIVEVANLDESTQEVVRQFERASGAELVLFVVGVLVVAPLAEELLFRGVVLRALMRRSTPVAAVVGSSILFAAAHVIGDPGTAYYMPAFLLLGLVSGWMALETGRIGPSILLHAGFNLLATIQVVT